MPAVSSAGACGGRLHDWIQPVRSVRWVLARALHLSRRCKQPTVGGNMTALTRMMAGTGLVAAMALGAVAPATAVYAQDTIKIGILHSLSGTMAISETTLKDTMLFLIDEQ